MHKKYITSNLKKTIIVILIIFFSSILMACESRKINEKKIETDIVKLSNEIANETNGAYLYFYRGSDYFQLQRYDEAISDYEKGWSLLKRIPEIKIYMLAKSYLLVNEVEKSYEVLDKGFAKNNDSYFLIYQRAINHDYSGKSKESICDYTKYINEKLYTDFPQNFAFALKRRGFLQISLGEVFSEGDYRVAKRLNPKDFELPYLIALAQYRNTDFKNAINNAQKAIRMNKDYNVPYILLAKIYTLTGDIDKAKEFLAQGVAAGYSNEKLGLIFPNNEIEIPLDIVKVNASRNKYPTSEVNPFIPLINLDEEASYYK